MKQHHPGVLTVAQWKRTQLISMRMQVGSLASLIVSRIQHCHELWCRSQTWLRSGVAVAVASSCSSDLTPSVGKSICRKFGPKKQSKWASNREGKLLKKPNDTSWDLPQNNSMGVEERKWMSCRWNLTMSWWMLQLGDRYWSSLCSA